MNLMATVLTKFLVIGELPHACIKGEISHARINPIPELFHVKAFHADISFATIVDHSAILRVCHPHLCSKGQVQPNAHLEA